MASTFYTMRGPMKRLLAALPAALVTLLVLAPAALAHDGGEGWWGETNDKVVTNAGFILIVFFPVFVLLMSLLQAALDRRKARRKKIQSSSPAKRSPGAGAGSRIFTEPAAAAATMVAERDPSSLMARGVPDSPCPGRSCFRVGAMTDEVRYERVGAAAVLTIDRPHRRNAVDGPTAERLLPAVEASRPTTARGCSSSPAPAAQLLRGRRPQGDRDLRRAPELPDGPMGFTRRTPTKPTIAAIGGWCLAGGLELALWCDLRVAAEGSTLGFPERRWGVPLIDGGTQRLPRIVGLGRALDLILTGRLVGTDEALAMGLLTEVVPAGEHLARALEMAEGLAAFPQETMLADRRAALEGFGLPLAEGLALEAQAGPAVFADAVAGAARFAGGEGRGGAGAGV